MSALVALIKAILEWLTDLAKQDNKAGDADATPQSLKDRWRRRIEEQEKKVKKEDTSKASSSDDSSN